MAKKWNWDLYNRECSKLPIGILTDPKDIERSEKLEAVRRQLIESDPPNLQTGQYDEPKTADELKQFFDAVIQKSEMLGRESDDVKSLKNWRKNDYYPDGKPSLENGNWDRLARRLKEQFEPEFPEGLDRKTASFRWKGKLLKNLSDEVMEAIKKIEQNHSKGRPTTKSDLLGESGQESMAKLFRSGDAVTFREMLVDSVKSVELW